MNHVQCGGGLSMSTVQAAVTRQYTTSSAYSSLIRGAGVHITRRRQPPAAGRPLAAGPRRWRSSATARPPAPHPAPACARQPAADGCRAHVFERCGWLVAVRALVGCSSCPTSPRMHPTCPEPPPPLVPAGRDGGAIRVEIVAAAQRLLAVEVERGGAVHAAARACGTGGRYRRAARRDMLTVHTK